MPSVLIPCAGWNILWHQALGLPVLTPLALCRFFFLCVKPCLEKQVYFLSQGAQGTPRDGYVESSTTVASRSLVSQTDSGLLLRLILNREAQITFPYGIINLPEVEL